jgi:hypothetical protein
VSHHVRSAVLIAVVSNASLLFSGCGKSTPPGQTGADAGVDTGTGTDNDAGAEPIAITLSEAAFTLATPDLHHGLTATVTGTATTTVTWSSSDLYCYMRESSGELIFTQFAPKGDGFVRCPGIEGGGLPTEGTLCLDGAAD